MPLGPSSISAVAKLVSQSVNQSLEKLTNKITILESNAGKIRLYGFDK